MKNKYIIFLLILLSFALLLFCVSCNDANAESNDEEKTELKTEQTEKETEHVHTFGEWVTVKYPSCTADGTAERECEECGECEQKNLSKTEHSLAQTVISPTCTAEGYTLYECKYKLHILKLLLCLHHSYGIVSVVDAGGTARCSTLESDCRHTLISKG